MASESSSISVTSQDHGNSFNTKNVVDKKENEQGQSSKSDSNVPIDFVKLSKEDSVDGSKVQEHDFFKPIQVGSPSDSANTENEKRDEKITEEKNSDSKTSYSCNFCKREFSTLQALGGHQNAHKAERALKKQREQRYNDALGLGQTHLNPYFRYPNALYSPYGSLGVRMDSMIQKPSLFSPRVTPNSFVYGHGGLCLQETLNPSLVNLRNNMEGSSSRVGILGLGGATSSMVENGANNKIGDFLKFGDSSKDVITSSNSIIDKKDDIHQLKFNSEEEPSDSESSGLDLTLKL